MIGKAGGDGRRSLHPTEAMAARPQLHAQAFVWGTEVVDTTHQVHEWLQGMRVAD